jgi:hypothetical protein
MAFAAMVLPLRGSLVGKTHMARCRTDPFSGSVASPPPSAGGPSELVSEINVAQPADPQGSATVVAMEHLLRYAGVHRPVQAREVSALLNAK